MSFFDQVFSDESGRNADSMALDEHEAFAAIAIAVSAVDGVVDDIEIENAVTYLRRMQLFSSYNTQAFVRLFEHVLGVLRRHGPEALVQAATEALSPELKETAFALSVDVALADGVVHPAEREMIAHLRQVLEVPDDLALKITEVMIIKNRG